jgi:transposase
MEGEDRGQGMLFPASLDEYVAEDSPVRVIDAFVGSLDLAKLGFSKAKPAETGRPAYDPGDLLRLYIYGYVNGIRSSRRLMRECRRNVEVMFLLRKLQPDFRTISDFRKENAAPLREVFVAFVKICNKQGLYGKKLASIDGTKIRASNAKKRAFNQKNLAEKIARINQNITQWLERMDELDAEESDDAQLSVADVKRIIRELEQRKDTYQGYQAELTTNDEKQKLLTDPEARVMYSKDGDHPAYNVQTAVDTDSHMIAEYMVTNQGNDLGLLHDVAEGVKKNLGLETIEAVGDKGYDSNEDALNCLQDGIVPQAALRYDKEERVLILEHQAAKIGSKTRASTEAKDIQACLRAGVLPECYEGKGVEIELQETDESLVDVAYFVRNEDNTVTCPMGQIMNPVKKRGSSTVYQNRKACHQCKNRCGKFRDYKTVLFAETSTVVPVRMPKGSAKKYRLTAKPPDKEVNPGCHSLDFKGSRGMKQVVITIKQDKRKLEQRKQTSEHPFGTIKRAMGFDYFLLRGIEKTSAETALVCLGYNLKRAINLQGVGKLLAALSS